MNQPKLSVIVPVYNAEKYIQESIESIIAQSFRDFELILVDDGSMDRSLAICEEAALKDNRIMVFHQENAGSAAAKNTGLEHATADYVAFVDADDTIDVDYYSNLYTGVESVQADVCIGSVAFVCVNEKGISSVRYATIHDGIFSLTDFMNFYSEYMPMAIIGSPWNKLYKRYIIEDSVLRFNTSLKNNEDTHFNYMFLAKCKTVYVCKSPYYNYYSRVGTESSSSRYIPDLFDVYVLTYHKALEFLRITGALNQNIDFQNVYFLDLVINAIGRIVSSQDVGSKESKVQRIHTICMHPDVVDAIKRTKLPSHKKQLALICIKKQMTILLYWMFRGNLAFKKLAYRRITYL